MAYGSWSDITEMHITVGKLYIAICHGNTKHRWPQCYLQVRQGRPWKSGASKALICYSKQGNQQRSGEYQKELENDIMASMSRNGNCNDGAPVESFFAIMKGRLYCKNIHTKEQTSQEILNSWNVFTTENEFIRLWIHLPAKNEFHWIRGNLKNNANLKTWKFIQSLFSKPNINKIRGS